MNPNDWNDARKDYLGWMSSWRDLEHTHKQAAETLKRYQNRPEIEFYSIIEDPYELNNLAAQEEYHPEIAYYRNILGNWMEEQGDLGRETELQVLQRKAKSK